MSDGPWRSLKMSRVWKRVARYVEMDVSSPNEVATAVEAALTNDSGLIPRKLLVALRRSFGDGPQQSLVFYEPSKLVALRSLAAGIPLAALLVSHATCEEAARRELGIPLAALLVSHADMVASDGIQGDSAARETVVRALKEWTSSVAGQVEEHHRREAPDNRQARNVGDRVKAATADIDMIMLANQVLDIHAHPKRQADCDFSGVDDGPRLPS